jgi:hypothetical protein
MRQTKWLLVIALIALPVVDCQKALSQTAIASLTLTASGTATAEKSSPYKRKSAQFVYKRLDKAPDLEAMPPWPSFCRCFDSIVSPSAVGGPVYQVQFACQINGEKVLQYFVQTLAIYKWELLRQNSRSILAKHDDTILSLQIGPATQSASMCNLLAVYVQKN